MPLVYDDYAYTFIWNGENGGNLIDGVDAEKFATCWISVFLLFLGGRFGETVIWITWLTGA